MGIKVHFDMIIVSILLSTDMVILEHFDLFEYGMDAVIVEYVAPDSCPVSYFSLLGIA